MTKPLVRPELRFKMDMIASKYNVPNRGMTIGQVVAGILESTNDLTQDEKTVLNQICKAFGSSLKEYERIKEGKKG